MAPPLAAGPTALPGAGRVGLGAAAVLGPWGVGTGTGTGTETGFWGCEARARLQGCGEGGPALSRFALAAQQAALAPLLFSSPQELEEGCR